jgi:beta-N-acetylhexosaminidase
MAALARESQGVAMSLGPVMIDVAGTELTANDREILKHPLVGSVILFTRNYVNPRQLSALVADIQSIRSPALLVAVDHEGGRVQRFRPGFSALPPLRRIGQLFDTDREQGLAMARSLGWLMAAEVLGCGLDFSFAPCVDLDYGMSEIIGDRSFHARAENVAQLAIAYMHGMRDAGMAATAKHFPGHGAVVADSHHALPVDRRELVDMDHDLLPYRRLIDNALPAVMVAHVLYTQVDDVPASFSTRWIQGVLRQDLGFGGLVFADDLTMGGAHAAGDLLQRAQRSLAAGCDVLPVCNDRPGAEHLLERMEKLGIAIDPASQLRLVRMRGRKQLVFENLSASAEWQSAREWLARSAASPPALDLSTGGQNAGG